MAYNYILCIIPSIVCIKSEESEEMGDKNEESKEIKNEDDQLHNAMGEIDVFINYSDIILQVSGVPGRENKSA